ncbi:alpha/beta hydrolase [Shewanella inventionis]|uniref:Transporter n=1 Tax=Shewanella inventionis TaxID=1738770 RepID=A0ABQ1J1B2_9GAMM|nr:alpha/beta hydrolase [Shewanella inventionis]MCL1157541.1 alpha/beta hydrolase [Shewanella inventionis]GGB57590.1 transporter [Shewanella inventionis]
MTNRKCANTTSIAQSGVLGLCQSATRVSRWVAVAAAILVANYSSAAPTNTPVAASAKTSTCYLDGMDEQLQCGKITVPENPKLADGKQIDIHFAILPAIKNTHPDEALLAISGGPGQSAIENAAGFNRMLTKVRQNRDILLIDQRGTGQSNLLSCDDENMSFLSINDSELDTVAMTEACLASIEADVTQYGSNNAVKDFEAVRQFLGYNKLHLYGISYGSRMAQLYMRHYPEALATVTLDGVVPMQQSLIAIGSSIERGLNVLWRDCQSNLECQQQFPDLVDKYNKVDQQLANAPISQQVRDPQTDELTEFLLTRSKFTGAIRMAMYMPNIRALIPHAIHQAANGNYQPILGIYALTADSTGIALGMHSTVVCGEDIHRITEQMRKDAKESYIAGSMLDGLVKTCEAWPIPAEDDSFGQPIDSDIPTLLLSGELDPATPPNWGAMAQEKLTKSKHLIAPYATHGVAYQSCGNDLIAQLVDQGSLKDINGECLQKDVRRSFYLNANTVETLPIVKNDTEIKTDTTAPAKTAEDKE